MTEQGTAAERLRRSIDALRILHSVIIGLALTDGIEAVMKPWLGGSPAAPSHSCFTLSPLLLLIALVATIIPFFHGATRHLDHVHLYTKNEPSHGAFLTDYIFLFCEGGVFVGIGLSLDSPPHFVWAVVVLLVIDLLWAGVTQRICNYEDTRHVKNWLRLDVGSLILMLPFILFAFFAPRWLDKKGIAAIICVAAILRTYVDYKLNWNFFFDISESFDRSA